MNDARLIRRVSAYVERPPSTGGFLVTADVHVTNPAALTPADIDAYVADMSRHARKCLTTLAKGPLT